MTKNVNRRRCFSAKTDRWISDIAVHVKSFQGIDPDLRKLEGSPDCDIVHGTYSSKLPKIFSSGGLSRMSRNHIHFSKGLPGPNTNVISGMRQDCDILLYVDFVKSTQGNSTYRNSLNYETGRIYMKYRYRPEYRKKS